MSPGLRKRTHIGAASNLALRGSVHRGTGRKLQAFEIAGYTAAEQTGRGRGNLHGFDQRIARALGRAAIEREQSFDLEHLDQLLGRGARYTALGEREPLVLRRVSRGQIDELGE